MSSPEPHASPAPPAPGAIAVAMRGITKRFPGVLANDDVSFEVAAGEVHALLGENGAGKTTLMNILTGLYRPDEGEIEVGGKRRRAPQSRVMRSRRGSGWCTSTSASSTRSASPRTSSSDRARSRSCSTAPSRTREVELISEALHMPVDPDAKIWQLSVGEQQRVEIMKAVRSGSQVLILDEPTAVLTPQEARRAVPHDPRHGGRGALGDRDHAQAPRGARGLGSRHRAPRRPFDRHRRHGGRDAASRSRR